MSDWRLIKTETHTATMNMALDEICMDHVREGIALPTIRFYRWHPNAVSIGYFQNISREISLDRCKGIDIVRRQTGGGSVYHDFKSELTYSVISKEELFPKNIIKSYELICNYIIDGLKNIGIKSKFAPINDILINDKKVSGSAQTRKKGVLLQHGTILYDVDINKMFSILKVSDEKNKDKMINNVRDRVTSIKTVTTDLSFKTFEESIINSFIVDKTIKSTAWSKSELEQSKKLAITKYKTDQWNYLR